MFHEAFSCKSEHSIYYDDKGKNKVWSSIHVLGGGENSLD